MNRHIWLIFLLLSIVIKLTISWIAASFLLDGPENKIEYQFATKEIEFISVIILAPVIETILLQMIPIELTGKLKNYLGNKSILAIGTLLSASLFAAVHFYSIPHLIIFFVIGLFYALVYQMAKTQFNKAFTTVLIIHLMNNLVTFLSQ